MWYMQQSARTGKSVQQLMQEEEQEESKDETE